MKYKNKNKIVETLFIASLLSIFPAKAQNHWTPDTNAFDNYMTITGYLTLEGQELQSDRFEVSCFIDGECRGVYRLQPAEYMEHPYTCFLSVWGSSSDNGKEIVILVYDHETDDIYETYQNVIYQYNRDIGTDSPIEIALTPLPTYQVTVVETANGEVSASQSSAQARTTITLTIAPAIGYELNAISAYKTDEQTTAVNLSGSGDMRTFIMPAFDVTVTATFTKTADRLSVEAAQSIIEGISKLSVSQTTANDEASVKEWLVAQINALSGMSATGIVVTAADITISGFKAAVAGTEEMPDGRNGSFNFTVTLTKDVTTLTTSEISGVIAATYHVITNIDDITQTKILKASTWNGRLYVSGLTVGKWWAVYNISGTLVHQSIAVNDETDLPLSVRSIYIVRSNGETVKVIY